jgi:hypothetical protein
MYSLVYSKPGNNNKYKEIFHSRRSSVHDPSQVTCLIFALLYGHVDSVLHMSVLEWSRIGPLFIVQLYIMNRQLFLWSYNRDAIRRGHRKTAPNTNTCWYTLLSLYEVHMQAERWLVRIIYWTNEITPCCVQQRAHKMAVYCLVVISGQFDNWHVYYIDRLVVVKYISRMRTITPKVWINYRLIDDISCLVETLTVTQWLFQFGQVWLEETDAGTSHI